MLKWQKIYVIFIMFILRKEIVNSYAIMVKNMVNYYWIISDVYKFDIFDMIV